MTIPVLPLLIRGQAATLRTEVYGICSTTFAEPTAKQIPFPGVLVALFVVYQAITPGLVYIIGRLSLSFKPERVPIVPPHTH